MRKEGKQQVFWIVLSKIKIVYKLRIARGFVIPQRKLRANKRKDKEMKYFTISNFICPECNGVIPLPRRKTREREKGHIKDIYCPWCNKVQKTIEYHADEPIRNGLGEIIVY